MVNSTLESSRKISVTVMVVSFGKMVVNMMASGSKANKTVLECIKTLRVLKSKACGKTESVQNGTIDELYLQLFCL